MDMNDKTSVLIEALPYINKYSRKVVVIKAGGNALSKKDEIIEDIVLLKLLGMKPVVVHGGGPEIDREMEKSGIKPRFIDGLRYTDEKVIKSVVKAFSKINRGIVRKIRSHGAKALSLKDCLKAKQKHRKYGLVGEITQVDKKKIMAAVERDYIPVISTIGIGPGKKYNINADTAAAHVAVALKAEKLTILTNVDGVSINGKLQSHVDFRTAAKEIKRGIITKGMIPKVNACIYAVNKKCPKAHLINGLTPHSLLLEIFTDEGVGTEIVYRNGS